MLTGLDKPQQILHFFQNFQQGDFDTKDISIYICNTFDLGDKNPTDKGMLAQINVEVSSTISKMLGDNRQINFERSGSRRKFSLRFKANPFVEIPTPIEIDVPNPYEINMFTNKAIQPAPKIEQIMEEASQELIPYIEDDNYDPFADILERITKMNLYDFDNLLITKRVGNKIISVNLTNA
jgi:hypothetical protein